MTLQQLPLGLSNAAIQKQRQDVPWIWHGVIALGGITLLSAAEKTGKTTFLSLLLDRRRAGGQLLGRAVWPGKTLVFSTFHAFASARAWNFQNPDRPRR